MRKNCKLLYSNYTVLYLSLFSVIIVALIGQKATHPGMALVLVSIFAGLLLMLRAYLSKGISLLLHICVFTVLEVVACLVIGSDRGLLELWFGSLYAILTILLGVDLVVRFVCHKRWIY